MSVCDVPSLTQVYFSFALIILVIFLDDEQSRRRINADGCGCGCLSLLLAFYEPLAARAFILTLPSATLPWRSRLAEKALFS